MTDSQPAVQVLAGNPTDEELAALIAVLFALGRRPSPPAAEPQRVVWIREFSYQTANSWRVAA